MSFIAVGVGLGIAAGAKTTGGIIAKNKAKREKSMAQNEYNRRMKAYEGLDTSNLYGNMQNTMEDMTVNLQQAEFMKQQQMQSQANVLQTLRASAGGSGIAALAQASQGQANIAAQKASASIGQQERQNQMLAAQQAAKLQQLEAAGATQARSLDYNKTSTLLGMSQQRLAGARLAEAQADAQIIGGIADLGGAVAGMGMSGAFSGGGSVAGGVGDATSSLTSGGFNFNQANAGNPNNILSSGYKPNFSPFGAMQVDNTGSSLGQSYFNSTLSMGTNKKFNNQYQK